MENFKEMSARSIFASCTPSTVYNDKGKEELVYIHDHNDRWMLYMKQLLDNNEYAQAYIDLEKSFKIDWRYKYSLDFIKTPLGRKGLVLIKSQEKLYVDFDKVADLMNIDTTSYELINNFKLFIFLMEKSSSFAHRAHKELKKLACPAIKVDLFK